MRGEPAALEGTKQLQRASLPTIRVCVCVCVIGSSQGETSARTHTHTLIARNGRPAAFVIECVTLSMMVLKKARPSRTPVALCISNRVW